MDIPSLGSLLERSDCWLVFNTFKIFFNQASFKYAGNLVTSEKFLGSGIKCDTYEPDSHKEVNALFNSFETALQTLY